MIDKYPISVMTFRATNKNKTKPQSVAWALASQRLAVHMLASLFKTLAMFNRKLQSCKSLRVSEFQLGLLCVEMCGYFNLLPQSKDMYIIVIANSKLANGVNVRVYLAVSLFLCAIPVMVCISCHVQGAPDPLGVKPVSVNLHMA